MLKVYEIEPVLFKGIESIYSTISKSRLNYYNLVVRSLLQYCIPFVFSVINDKIYIEPDFQFVSDETRDEVLLLVRKFVIINNEGRILVE